MKRSGSESGFLARLGIQAPTELQPRGVLALAEEPSFLRSSSARHDRNILYEALEACLRDQPCCKCAMRAFRTTSMRIQKASIYQCSATGTELSLHGSQTNRYYATLRHGGRMVVPYSEQRFRPLLHQQLALFHLQSLEYFIVALGTAISHATSNMTGLNGRPGFHPGGFHQFNTRFHSCMLEIGHAHLFGAWILRELAKDEMEN
jgi:hypothetical protein